VRSTSSSGAKLPVTGLILAGGMGRRMDSRDKGLVEFRGRAMVAHAIDRLAPQVASLLINANRNTDVYSAFSFPVVNDEVSGFAGPLAGLHAGMRVCETALIATVPCDSPFLPLDLVARLHETLTQDDADIAVAATSGPSPQLQPVFALYKTSLLPSLETFLSEGGRKIDKWYEQHKTIPVAFEDEVAFANINTIAELAALQDDASL
jgi:molybdenum cofactor guanylyltransferase